VDGPSLLLAGPTVVLPPSVPDGVVDVDVSIAMSCVVLDLPRLEGRGL